MRILVTGGAGFIGSHLCGRLIADGHRVTVLDNLVTGSLSNLATTAKEGPGGLTFLYGHVEQSGNGISGLSQFDRIYNLACLASPPWYQARPINTVETSVFGAAAMLRLAARTGARILQASTSEVYGDPEVHPQTEDYVGSVNPIGPRSCYDEGKRCAEAMFFAYQRELGVDIRIARIFNTYGPRMRPDDGRVVSTFVVQALRGEPLSVFGDGDQTRSLCYVDDTVEALIRLMESNSRGPMNIGNPCEVSMRDLAKAIIGLAKSKSTIAHFPLPVDDPRRRRPDISYATKALGWEPRVALPDGLAKTIDYFATL